ncbi:MAG: FlgD immunoglobulin-like domain containing protein, partial [Candidatus Latescibacterota bacterium]
MTSFIRQTTIGLFALFCLSAGAGYAYSDASPTVSRQFESMTAESSSPAAQSSDIEGSDVVHTIYLTNGIEATIYSSAYLASQLGPGDVLQLADGRYFDVITDINDPSVVNKGDGSFHPFVEAEVLRALEEISYPDLRIRFNVYLLPYPRKNLLISSAGDREIFLSPHVLEIPRDVTAYIVTHEVGHVFQFINLPDRDEEGWSTYKEIRGITDAAKYSPTGSHAYRPKEIFAEDFRVLFGGIAAKYDGVVENPELVSPMLVSGLEEFFLSLEPAAPEPIAILALSNSPNPFNPFTEIRVRLGDEFIPGAGSLTIHIYDVTGVLVKTLYSGRPGTREVRMKWDGTSDNGTRVASAAY